MKRTILLFTLSIFYLITTSTNLKAQDEITDDQLRKYALMSEVITLMKKDISIELNKLIKAQEGMTGTRYKELAATKGDSAKLAEVGAKDFEKQFWGIIEALKASRTEAIKSVNSDLATKMVGDKGKVYKRIKSELGTNTDLKARYDQILATIKMENQ